MASAARGTGRGLRLSDALPWRWLMQPRLSTLRPAIPEARGPPSLALEKILGAKEKVLIFCSYLPTIELLEEQIKAQFGCIVLKMHGAMDLKAPSHEGRI